jgi:tripartite-type tricarboxylate transporter receptor subunit TctC
MKTMSRVGYSLAFIPAFVLLAHVGVPTADAQQYPNNTVKIVVPFVAGGGVDAIARVVAPYLGEALGQTVIIDNRGGAGGSVGAAAVAKAPGRWLHAPSGNRRNAWNELGVLCQASV